MGAVSLQSNRKLWTSGGGTELLADKGASEASGEQPPGREEHRLLPAASLQRPLLTGPNMLSTKENDFAAPRWRRYSSGCVCNEEAINR